jgi:hypothetical protein
MPSRDYLKQKSELREIVDIKRDLKRLEGKIPGLEDSVQELTEKVNSNFQYIISFSWIGSGVQKRRERELTSKAESLQEMKDESAEKQAERMRLTEQKERLARFTASGKRYLALTGDGTHVAEALRVRSSCIGSEPYLQATAEIREVEREISNRAKQRGELFSELRKRGFESTDKVLGLAAALCGLNGTDVEILDRAMVVNNHLYNQKWETYDRLPVAAAVAMKDGEIDELKQELVDTFLAMTNDGETAKSYAMWNDAARVMDIDAGSIEAAIERYNAVGQAAYGDKWEPQVDIPSRVRSRSSQSYYRHNIHQRSVVGALALREGEPAALANELWSLRGAMGERDLGDSLEVTRAALALVGGEGTIEERADRVREAMDEMIARGYQNNVRNVPIAGFIASLPGTPAENAQLLKHAVNAVVEQGFTNEKNWNPYQYAPSVLGAGMYALASNPNVAFYSSSPSYSSPSNYSSGGFSMTGAMLGDMMDNGRIDFSGGFAAGGLLGGGLF